jgi:hypothetical protein
MSFRRTVQELWFIAAPDDFCAKRRVYGSPASFAADL